MSPQPIDTRRLTIARKGCNGSRRRRFSLDGAKAQYYAAKRQKRFTALLAAS